MSHCSSEREVNMSGVGTASCCVHSVSELARELDMLWNIPLTG
jgi:hypothetical protein